MKKFWEYCGKKFDDNMQYQEGEKTRGILFGSYPQGKDGTVKPIEWIPLKKEGNKVLLISRYGLDVKPFNSYNADVTWKYCTLRKWLNSDFLNKAFTQEEQSRILTATVSADKNPDYNTNPGKSTEDKVFLLSIKEAEEYFESDDDRACEPTEYANANKALTYDENCFWWLRSPGFGRGYIALILPGGFINKLGYFPNYDNSCVRPVLWINLES